MGRRYEGRREGGTCVVEVIEGDRHSPLRPRLDLFNHSPTGFEWGYAGSGPAQLALALLADAIDDDALAVRLHQKFKAHYIQYLSRNADDDPWVLHQGEIRDFAYRERVDAR